MVEQILHDLIRAHPLGTLVILFSGPYMAGEVGEEKYYAMLLAMIGLMNGLVCATDLFNLWVWFEGMAVSPDGKRQKAEVKVTVLRRDWKFVRKKTAGDRWETLSEPVEEQVSTCTVKVEQVPGGCTFTPKAPGFHVVQAEVTDAQKRKQTTRSALYVVVDGRVTPQVKAMLQSYKLAGGV